MKKNAWNLPRKSNGKIIWFDNNDGITVMLRVRDLRKGDFYGISFEKYSEDIRRLTPPTAVLPF